VKLKWCLDTNAPLPEEDASIIGLALENVKKEINKNTFFHPPGTAAVVQTTTSDNLSHHIKQKKKVPVKPKSSKYVLVY
jgi:hypothetical protein